MPIYYESRLARLELNADETPSIDDEVEDLMEGEEESARARAKTKWAALEKLVGAEPRIAKIADDLMKHYEQRDSAMAGKAMVVCMSREICVDLYNAIVALRPARSQPDAGYRPRQPRVSR